MEDAMLQSASNLPRLTTVAAALGLAYVTIAWAQSQDATPLLKDNDGIFVDKKTFKVVRANGAKGDPAATLARMGAREVSGAAVIYRLGDKLYIVDGTPPAETTPQFMTTLHDWCPTCHWYTPGSYMR
jgi:hypothetical protein